MVTNLIQVATKAEALSLSDFAKTFSEGALIIKVVGGWVVLMHKAMAI